MPSIPRLITVLFLLFTISSPSWAEDPARFAPLTEETESELIKTFSDPSYPAKLPELAVVPKVPDKLRGVWAGTKLSGDFDGSTNVFFANQAGGSQDKRFGVEIAFRDEKAMVKHSAARYRRYLGGITMTLVKRGRRAFFLDGKDGSGVVLLFPPYHEGFYSAFVCPREMRDAAAPTPTPKWKESAPVVRASILRPSSYSFSESVWNIESGRVSASASFGYPGKLRASIVTTENIAPSDPFEDSVGGKEPLVEVPYNPRADWTPAASVQMNYGGIRGEVELEAPSKHKRFTAFELLLSVKDLSNLPGFFVTVGEREIEVKGGPCALVTKQRRVIDEYQDPEVK